MIRDIKILNAIPLRKSQLCEEWDLCIDGVWYSADFEGTDTSDKSMLEMQIKEKGLEINRIPFWNSCDKTKTIGYKHIVYVNKDEAYLIDIDAFSRR